MNHYSPASCRYGSSASLSLQSGASVRLVFADDLRVVGARRAGSRVGRQVAREFTLEDVPFVVIDNNPDKIEQCLAENYLAMVGEASDDDILEEAGVRRAKGLVAAVN